MRTTNKNISIKKRAGSGKLFVYGTLRGQYGHKLSKLIRENFQLIGVGHIKGDLFDIGKYPGAVLSRSTSNNIVGEIYQAKKETDIDSTLKILDKYEGYYQGDLPASEYIRKRKFVKLKNGKRVLSWVYLYNKPVANKHLIEGGDYLRHLESR
ncbi:MAG: gamma-glutamylcyclotransferase [Bacteroidetes bacterium]|nr:MAG: gamma-glutamylcyclotransferase [Bacteroidota bacterium]